MNTRFVSIISDHLLPNYRFIKEMEGKHDALPENSMQRITVSEDNLKGYTGTNSGSNRIVEYPK